MQFSLIDQPALRLITVKADRFPEGTRDAFSKLENKMSTLQGRRMYGLVYGTEQGLEYHAGLAPESEAEERAFGFPILEVPAGRCARAKLLDWSGKTDQIGPLIGQMIAQFGIDPSRPTIEYYRSLRELHLLVPIL